MKTMITRILVCVLLFAFVLGAAACCGDPANEQQSESETNTAGKSTASFADDLSTEIKDETTAQETAQSPLTGDATLEASKTLPPTESGETAAQTPSKTAAPSIDESPSKQDESPSVTPETPTEPSTPLTPIEPSVTTGDQTDAIKFSISDVSGKPGENVKAILSVSDNPGIAGYSVSVLYDDSKLEIVSVSIELGAFSTSNKNTPGKLRIMATDQGENALKGDGVCAEIVFKIKEGALQGEELTLTPCLRDGSDSVYRSGEGYPSYPAKFIAGKITVVS